MNATYIWFVCLSILLSFVYIGLIYWKRYEVAPLGNLSWANFFLYTGTPATILILGMTLYSMYKPMQHFPPLFILVLYALLGGLYTLTIGYLGYIKLISVPHCILMSLVFLAVIISIFMYTPANYDDTINEVENKFLKNKKDEEELDKLRAELTIAFSNKNKYYIHWFIALLYIPIILHYAYRCALNPVAYQSIYDYILKIFNIKSQKTNIYFIPQSNDMLKTLDELDKVIQYTKKEKIVIDKIRSAITEKKDPDLTSDDYSVLRKIRKYLEKHDFFINGQTNLTSIYQTLTYFINTHKISIQENGLYLMNLIIILAIMCSVFVYDHTTKLLIIPLISVIFSLSIFYLKG